MLELIIVGVNIYVCVEWYKFSYIYYLKGDENFGKRDTENRCIKIYQGGFKGIRIQLKININFFFKKNTFRSYI